MRYADQITLVECADVVPLEVLLLSLFSADYHGGILFWHPFGSFSFGRFCVYVSVVGKNNIKTALSTKNIYCFNECKYLSLFFCQTVLV